MAALSGNITSAATSVSVSDGTEFKINEYCLCDNEIMLISNVSSNTLTVTRAALSTTNTTHSSGTTIYPYLHYKWLREPERNEKWINREVSYETGATQIQGTTIHPLVSWKLSFSGDKTTYSSLKSFFNARCGKRKIFYWIDEEQTIHKVRFGQDEITLKQKLQFNSSGNLELTGFSTDFVLNKEY